MGCHVVPVFKSESANPTDVTQFDSNFAVNDGWLLTTPSSKVNVCVSQMPQESKNTHTHFIFAMAIVIDEHAPSPPTLGFSAPTPPRESLAAGDTPYR